jgi:hypothetical protein
MLGSAPKLKCYDQLEKIKDIITWASQGRKDERTAMVLAMAVLIYLQMAPLRYVHKSKSDTSIKFPQS